MIYPQHDPKDVPLSKVIGAYLGPDHDVVAEREISNLTHQVEKLRRQLEKTRQEMQAWQARTRVLLTITFVLLGALGIWLAAITYRLVQH